MTDRDKLIGERLRKERESLGYKLNDVAQKMGFEHHQILGNIESGKRPLKAVELVQLSGLYGRNAAHFLREDSAVVPRVLWRDAAKTDETVLAERKFIEICEGYTRLLHLTKEDPVADAVPCLALPDKRTLIQRGFGYIIGLAEQARKSLALGARPAHSLANVLESNFGVLVLYRDLKNAGSAASLSVGDCRAIVINSTEAPWRRNYDLAHELFHLVTWDLFSEEEIALPSRGGKKSLVEQLADAFASALLLPEEEVRSEFRKKVVDRKITYISLVEIAREFKVSTDALLWRLTNLGLLRQKDVEKCLTEGEIRNVDRQARSEDGAWEKAPHLSARYVMLAIKAYFMGKISRARFSEYVDIPFSSVSDFLEMNGYRDDGNYSIALTAHS
jgi:Zn-dependent peptidase ImmA (M78 family)/transcriptional regulator with XRE-family HTH domain